MMQMYFSRSSSTAFLLNKPLIHKRTLRNLHKIFLRKIKNHVIYFVRSNIDNGFLGEVTEWLKVLAWNAGVVKATEGSNPSLTAIFPRSCGVFLLKNTKKLFYFAIAEKEVNLQLHYFKTTLIISTT